MPTIISNEEALQRVRDLIAGGYQIDGDNEEAEEFSFQGLLQHFPWILGVLGVPPKAQYTPIELDTPLSPAQIDIQHRRVSARAATAVEIIRRGKKKKSRERAIEVVMALSQGILMEDLYIRDDEELLRIINLAMAVET